VHLTCQRVEGQRLRITVADTGPGIPQAALDRLFVPFERLSSQPHGVEGTGLGLPLSKGLAEAMGGTLALATTSDQGSAFSVELPLTDSPTARAERQERWPEPPEQPEAPRAPLKVLYIEDNVSNLQLVEQLLRRRPNVTLISAMRPQLGLDLAAEHHPDLVLLDLHLPDLPGEQVLHRLRANPATAQVPVVILSADARPSQIERLLGQGARAYLTKPLDIKQFLTLLDAIAAERARPSTPTQPSSPVPGS
jgi:CheY-like chemotaxis protein